MTITIRQTTAITPDGLSGSNTTVTVEILDGDVVLGAATGYSMRETDEITRCWTWRPPQVVDVAREALRRLSIRRDLAAAEMRRQGLLAAPKDARSALRRLLQAVDYEMVRDVHAKDTLDSLVSPEALRLAREAAEGEA